MIVRTISSLKLSKVDSGGVCREANEKRLAIFNNFQNIDTHWIYTVEVSQHSRVCAVNCKKPNVYLCPTLTDHVSHLSGNAGKKKCLFMSDIKLCFSQMSVLINGAHLLLFFELRNPKVSIFHFLCTG